MYHQLLSKQHLINGLRSGAAQPHVYAKDIAQLQVSIPSFPDQLRIAAILDKADDLRAKRCEVLAQLDILAQSIFIEMFGDPVSNPKGWQVVPLGRVVMPLTKKVGYH
jgi:type I restriction enzyme S subunit